jgi:hypothetical protein
MKRIVVLAALVLGISIVLGGLARQGVFPVARSGVVAEPVRPETTLVAVWDGRALRPDRMRVPRGTRVTVRVTSTSHEFGGNLAIPGYGFDGPRIPLVPGAERSATFVTDRPGDGFEITIGGVPAGRFDVTGEHLEEDRR